MVLNFAVPVASGDQISDLRAQAGALAARIQSLGFQEDALSEQYDSDVLNVQTLEGQVAQAAQQVAQASAQASRSRSVLQADAIQAYVHGGGNPVTSNSDPLTSATDSILRAEYVDSLATDESDAIDAYRLAALQDQDAKARLQQQTAAAQAAVRRVSQARQAATAVQAQLQSTLNQDKGRIAVLVAQQQAAAAAAAAARAAAEQAAAEQAAAEQAAAEQAAAQQAAAQPAAVQPAQQVAATSTAAPAPQSAAPPTFAGAAGAVAAAESRVGDPYVFGGAGPSAFDCSGLVEWAYAQVGISLPHFSGAQYAATIHISMSELQPGDLVFFGDPAQHVAIYVGNGMIVEAAHLGVPVHIVPLYPEFVLASRVE